MKGTGEAFCNVSEFEYRCNQNLALILLEKVNQVFLAPGAGQIGYIRIHKICGNLRFQIESVVDDNYRRIFQFFVRPQFWAAKTISKDLPLPWKCHINPLRGAPATTRSTMAFAPSYCW